MLTSHDPSKTTQMDNQKSPVKQQPDQKIEIVRQNDAENVEKVAESVDSVGDLDKDQQEAMLAGRAVEVPLLMDEGRTAFKSQNWEEAVSKFGEASSILAVVSGLESVEYADSLVWYGRALCKNAVQSAGLVDNKNVDKKTVPTEEDGEAAPANSRFHFSGDAESSADEEEEEEQEIDTDENNDDFTLAWEALEHARIIYEKSTANDSKHKLAEVFMHMGDVCLEDDNTDQSIEVFQQALTMKKALLQPDNRELAEVYHLLGLAYEHAGKIDLAIENILHARQVLEARQGVLEKAMEVRAGPKGKAPMTPETEADQSEVAEIKEILPELDNKIEDLKGLRDQQAEADKVANQEKMGGSILAQNPSAPVNDLTGLVVKKRKAPEEGKDESEKDKRPKND